MHYIIKRQEQSLLITENNCSIYLHLIMNPALKRHPSLRLRTTL